MTQAPSRPAPSGTITPTQLFDLARPMVTGMPQSPNHPAYAHALVRRHGDVVRADGGSAANDVVILGTHVGTHIDALAHVSHNGRLYGGVDAGQSVHGGRFSVHGVETIAPFFCRGVLLDIPALRGEDSCPPGYEISPEDLDAACDAQDTRPGPGDVVLILSGWGRNWGDRTAYLGHASGVPGVSEAGAHWIARHGVRAAGADTIAFERLAPGAGHAVLPAHRVLLVEQGIHLIETMALDELAAAGVYEFLFVAAPLPLVGATGSPIRPLAVVHNGLPAVKPATRPQPAVPGD